jgi:hypothetical protein
MHRHLSRTAKRLARAAETPVDQTGR